MKSPDPSTRFGLLMIGLGGLFGILFGAGAAAFVDSEVLPPPVAIPISVGYTSHGLAFPVVQVKVLGGPRLHLLLDTGSSGVEIFRASLNSTAGFGPGGIDEISQTFGDGTTVEGYADSTQLEFGSRKLLTQPLNVEMVAVISCALNAPCGPEGELALGQGAYQVNGILGVGPDPDTGEVPNPIRMLADPYDRTWTVAIGPAGIGGTLTLGSVPPTSPRAVISMPRVSPRHRPGGFRDEFRACWQIGGDRRWCVPTRLDTGTSATVLYRKSVDFQTVSGVSLPKLASPGQEITVRLPNGPTVVQTTTNGVEEGGTYVFVWPNPSEFAVAGVQDLGDLSLTYDIANSQLLIG